jgi:hypothetical protein
MKKRFLSILSIALVLLTLKGIKADDTTLLDFDISGAVADPDDDTTYYVQIPSDRSKKTVTLTATGDDLDAGDATLTCTACDGSIDDPEEDGNPQWDIDNDEGEQSDNGNGELITWDIDSSVSPRRYDFTVNSVSQNYKCPSNDTSTGHNTAEDDNGSQTYTIIPIPKIPVTINAYIPGDNMYLLITPPSNWWEAASALILYPIPSLLTPSVAFQGDNRGPGGEYASSRTSQRLNITPCSALNASGYNDYNVVPGLTIEYDANSSLENGNLTQAAKSDNQLNDGYLKIAQAYTDTSNATVERNIFLSTTKFQIKYRNYCADPLVPTIPYFGIGTIGYDVTMIVDYTSPDNPKYKLTGNCKAFPSLEIFMNHESKYTFNATHTGYLALFDLSNPALTETINQEDEL